MQTLLNATSELASQTRFSISKTSPFLLSIDARVLTYEEVKGQSKDEEGSPGSFLRLSEYIIMNSTERNVVLTLYKNNW
ncbi:hypothetical protein C0J52_06507 [Blattella germanica]|nr:hypothetical protein C0J52_06507 [Blattella germanica]